MDIRHVLLYAHGINSTGIGIYLIREDDYGESNGSIRKVLDVLKANGAE